MKTYTFNDFTIDNDVPQPVIFNDDFQISLFNTSVPDIFRDMAEQAINKYMAEHQELTFDKSDRLSAILEVDVSRTLKLEERARILISIYNREVNRDLYKDCYIDVPLLPTESYFKDFKKLVLAEVEKMIFD